MWRGRFPGEIRAGMLITDVGMAVATFLPKLRGDGNSSRFGRTWGSAGPTLPPLATAFGWVTGRWALLRIRRCRGFVRPFALSCGPSLQV